MYSLNVWDRHWQPFRQILKITGKRHGYWQMCRDMWKALIPFSRKRIYRKRYRSGTACSCPYLISWI